jgi:hypothetical protein
MSIGTFFSMELVHFFGAKFNTTMKYENDLDPNQMVFWGNFSKTLQKN